MVSTAFQFVDNANIDAKTRKEIRSQVMRGKNAGKKKERIKHERKKLAVLTSKPAATSTTRSNSNDTSDKSTEASDDSFFTPTDAEVIEWAITKATTYRYWNDYSMYKYPCELEWQMRRALHFCKFDLLHEYFGGLMVGKVMLAATDIMYPRELCYDVQCPASAFFDLFQTDEAFFHCFVGISEGMRCIITGINAPTELGLRSLANTYHCINKELESNKEPSWGTLASVMSLVMHENLFGMVGKSKLHLQALERMVELKGGLHKIESRIALLHKICRSDVEYSLQTGCRPRFNRDAWPTAELEFALTKADIYPTAKLDFVDTTIRGVFDDCIDVCHILNTEVVDPTQIMVDGEIRPRLSGTSFQEILISIQYRLLHSYPIAGERPIDPLDNACHLTMLAVITTMMIRGSPKHAQYYTMVREKLLLALEALGDKHGEFKFWAYFVGGASVFDNDDDWVWLALKIQALAKPLGISTPADARSVLIKFPWVRFFHDQYCGSVFWNTFASSGNTLNANNNTTLMCVPYLKGARA